MIDPRHLKVVQLIDAIVDKLQDLDIHLPEPYKRRDRREPGRTEKEAFEDKIARIIKKRFRKQEENLRRYFDIKFIGRQKQADEVDPIENALVDAETEALLFALFIAMAEHEVELFSLGISVPLNIELLNTVPVAKRVVGELIKNIDESTRVKVEESIKAFIDTPGQTVDDLVDMLPFDTARSLRIATTEVTNLYAEMALEAAAELQDQFPDVMVVNTWNTNNDPLVCIICMGLDQQQAKPGELFLSQPPTGDGNLYARPGDPHPNDRCWLTTRTVI